MPHDVYIEYEMNIFILRLRLFVFVCSNDYISHFTRGSPNHSMLNARTIFLNSLGLNP